MTFTLTKALDALGTPEDAAKVRDDFNAYMHHGRWCEAYDDCMVRLGRTTNGASPQTEQPASSAETTRSAS